MPLVEHFNLPTFRRLRDQGQEVLSLERALHQDIRELHIGFLNMMPDAALEATERQFIRLIGNCNRIAQFFVYPFSLPGLPRGDQALGYIEQHYARFEDLKEQGLDALIITGANVANPALDEEPFWEPLMEVVAWAEKHVSSVLCSCLATHALLKHGHGIERRPLPAKRWGVYSHRTCCPDHPLLREINTRFDTPHSRYNDISREQLEAAGLTVLVEGEESGVHTAVSPDGFRVVYFQGHPEYDANSLLKEYRREVMRFLAGELKQPPPLPENYMDADAVEIAESYLREASEAIGKGQEPAEFPVRRIEPLIDNTWGDTAKAMFNNWLGLVYQVTDVDRRLQFMPGVDPSDPLGLR
ncbi:homoserine O-succinyltransferase MetA [Elongatibacter sediminis]|uniref:Homoserine O-succinyltransferase n=1 Tax=Elongatibacter sediminis TaxID=3119006 RepID=A0AAW9RFE7_9GAMM